MSSPPLILTLILLTTSAMALTPEDAAARLRMARQIARERNDKTLVNQVDKLDRDFKAGLPAEGEEWLRDAEKAVGIDPGGWSMAGQPLFHPTARMADALKASRPQLAAAMASGDAAAVRKVGQEIEVILGDQAGVPDGRRMGQKAGDLTISRAEALRGFLAALETEGRTTRTLMKGGVLPDHRGAARGGKSGTRGLSRRPGA